jgi:pyruvate dehydrogenase E1 component alpha subunit/2-oxoisovalerate dehydrogenase E1 component alpha subunit
VRVDGNDILAVYKVTREAVDRARAGGGPTFIEALTYRVSAHSSSDDPTRYRDETVTEQWKQKDPIARFRTFLLSSGVLDEAGDARIRDQIDREVRDAIAAEEAVPLPALATLVEDVYSEVPWHLREQLDAVLHLKTKG